MPVAHEWNKHSLLWQKPRERVGERGSEGESEREGVRERVRERDGIIFAFK